MSVTHIISKELKSFFVTPTVYVCLSLFVLLANYLTFVVGNFFAKNEASLTTSFFQWIPWLLAFFAPAICMRLWSEEYRQKTLELLLTMGFEPWQLVMGKFLAAWCVLLIGLLLTSPIVVMLYLLGPPDGGAVLVGYIGSALVAACFLSISIVAASMTRNQFISYICGAGFCTALLILGSIDSMNVYIRMFSETSMLTDYISAISIISHFSLFLQGAISISSMVYFISIVGFSLYLAQHLIGVRNQWV